MRSLRWLMMLTGLAILAPSMPAWSQQGRQGLPPALEQGLGGGRPAAAGRQVSPQGAQGSGYDDSGALQRPQSVPLHTRQDAWRAPKAAQGQTKPGITRYNWDPYLVMAVAVRDFMTTVVQLPNFEEISQRDIIMGDGSGVFEATSLAPDRPNVVLIKARNPEADTNMSIMGSSGRMYHFYLASYPYNDEAVTDVAVYVQGPAPWSQRLEELQGSAAGKPAVAKGKALPASGPAGTAPKAAMLTAEEYSSCFGSGARPGEKDYLREIPVDPANFKFDLGIFASDDDATDAATIAPERIFHDGLWTWFDFGEKADVIQRPVVSLVVDGVDNPINTRTCGPKRSVLVAEVALLDGQSFTLQNGHRILCIRRKSAPYVEPVDG